MKKRNLLSLISLALLVTGCGDNSNSDQGPAVTYQRGSEEVIYDAVFGDFAKLAEVAKGIADDDQRFAAYAEAEAALLDSGAFVPTTTQGGNYAITRVAPRTVPYVNWGNDSDRLGYTVVTNEFIKSEDREAMLELWKTGLNTGSYDPKAYLEGKDYTFNNKYVTTFTTAPATLDSLNTSEQADTEYLVNCFEGLVEYDNLTKLNGAAATGYTVSEDGLTYSFTIRDGAKWYKADGNVYAEGTADADVKADDFVAGFQHMLDTAAGLEYLVDGVVAGVHEYLAGDITDFSKVGVKAEGNKVVFTLVKPESFFPTRLTYSCFLPINRAFFLSQGGAFGIEEFGEAKASASYKYGNAQDLNSMVYNGAFIPKTLNDQELVVTKNANYWNASKVNMSEIKWIYEDGKNGAAFYAEVVKGTFSGCGLSQGNGTLELAKEDGNFDKYHYVADTNATTYMGAVNTNRGTYGLTSGGCVSTKSEEQKIATAAALRNKNFRKALLHAWDRATWNGVSVGDDLKANNLRNMYTHPGFVTLSKAVVDRYGHEFAKGTTYGEMVQHYANLRGLQITVDDGQDGWYKPAVAKEYLELAKAELGQYYAAPITIDVVYYGASASQTGQVQAFKASIEAALGAENVVVNPVNATTTDDYYACGYRTHAGIEVNQDFFYGSGWGPDYGDPSTYLDTFLGDGAGYMTKICGLF